MPAVNAAVVTYRKRGRVIDDGEISNFKFQISNEKLKMFVETLALLHFSFFI